MRDIQKAEKKILKKWEKDDTFRESVRRRRERERFVYFDGPPTANGRPGIHHAMISTFKDLMLRYKTMRGYLVERRRGWDTHGLPVELEVEKELGFKGKADIEKYGIAKFNAKAKKSVWTYKEEWEQMDARIGFWVDHDDPYITYENGYIASIWWALKQTHQNGLLEEDYKVVPYCPRCGTALASHEVSQGYATAHDRSVTAAFAVKGEQNVSILAWTTTPWTLPGNVALAVGKDIVYAEVYVAEQDRTYILAKDAVERVMGGVQYEIRAELPGEKLAGIQYEPLFPMRETQNEKSHAVYLADFVNTEDGTGVVHTAVMYGEDDYQLGEQVGLPKVHTVGEDGRFLDFVPDDLSGHFVKDEKTEKRIIELLRSRGLLFAESHYKHEYPFCWRCKTPLLYYARTSWYIRMSRMRSTLLEENNRINWVPSHLRDGRFGEWLREVKDWAISRERYWGTPLPIWRCEEDASHISVIGGAEDLARRVSLKNTYLLVRHGEAESNVRHILHSEPNGENPLTDTGRKQAEAAAKDLKDRNVHHVYTSDLMRAHQTASIIGETVGIEPKVDERLREIKLGEFEGKSLEEYQAHIEISARTAFTKKPRGGENWSETRARMVRFIREIEQEHEGKTIVIVSHAGPLVMLEMAMRGLPDDAYFTGQVSEIDNAQVVELRGGIGSFDDEGNPDLHRPWIDAVEFACEHDRCGGTMRRIPDVGDVWLDSGCMPFAQWHWPASGKEKIDPAGGAGEGNVYYPADFIVEAIDQTRGWFYTLLAVAVMLGWERPYRNVISTGHVLDKHGKKMSKSRGNAADPWEMIEKYGADAVRWYFLTLNQPWDPKRFDEKDVRVAMSRMLGTLLNSNTFLKTYGTRGAYTKLSGGVPEAKTRLDAWILSRLQGTLKQVTQNMDAYEVTEAARALEAFVIDDLSNWYVRRSRERFQRPKNAADRLAASQLLAYVLVQTSRALAPFIPFSAEAVYLDITKDESVHFTDFPEPSAPLVNEDLEEKMRQAQDLVAEGLAIRKTNKLAVRQPLAAASAGETHDAVLADEELAEIVCDELNVKAIVRHDIGLHDDWLKLPEGDDAIRLDPEITPKLRIEGQVRELFRTVQGMRKEAGFKPKDNVTLAIVGSGAAYDAFVTAAERDPDALRLSEVRTKKGRKKYLAETEVDIPDNEIWLGVAR